MAFYLLYYLTEIIEYYFLKGITYLVGFPLVIKVISPLSDWLHEKAQYVFVRLYDSILELVYVCGVIFPSWYTCASPLARTTTISPLSTENISL